MIIIRKEFFTDAITWLRWKIREFKRGVKNLYEFFPLVWKTRDFDYGYILKMQKFQLEKLLVTIENGIECDEGRLPKVEDIKRCLQIMDNIEKDNYAERCGYKTDDIDIVFEPVTVDGEEHYEMKNKHPQSQTKEELRVIFENARKLEKEEWDELWETIKNGNKSNHGMQGWWD